LNFSTFQRFNGSISREINGQKRENNGFSFFNGYINLTEQNQTEKKIIRRSEIEFVIPQPNHWSLKLRKTHESLKNIKKKTVILKIN